MKSTPPACGPCWTIGERAALAAWIAEITLGCIERDNPAMPVVAKRPMRELMQTIHQILTAPTELLEANRDALQKPYDSADARQEVFVVGDLDNLRSVFR